MTPTYTLDYVRAALGDDAADKVRDYTPPPPVSPELRLARECAAAPFDGGDGDLLIHADYLRGDNDYRSDVRSARLALQRRHELDTPAEPQADDDGWIAWHGGECPVPLDSKPGVRFRGGGSAESGAQTGRFWDWRHDLTDRDIIAYKPEPGK